MHSRTTPRYPKLRGQIRFAREHRSLRISAGHVVRDAHHLAVAVSLRRDNNRQASNSATNHWGLGSAGPGWTVPRTPQPGRFGERSRVDGSSVVPRRTMKIEPSRGCK